MEALAEKVFTGNWRSFKIFKSLGSVQLHTKRNFLEFDFMCEHALSISWHDANKTEKLSQTDQWKVSFQKKKYFLTVTVPKMVYEIITINHTVMVLLDVVSGDKIFFAKEPHWLEYLKANRTIVI